MYNLKALDYEISGHHPDSQEGEGDAKNTQPNDDDAIAFSVDLIKLLEVKAEEHNGLHPQKQINVDQLKQVYYTAAKNPCNEGFSLGEWALARVNMFLRLKREEGFGKIEKQVAINNYLDISEGWIPSEEDFEGAKKEIEENKLNYSFEDIEELYLEPYKSLSYCIEY